MCELCEDVEVHIGRDGGLAQHTLEDLPAAAVVGQWDVDQLVQATGTQQGRVDDVRPGGRSRGSRGKAENMVFIVSGLKVWSTAGLPADMSLGTITVVDAMPNPNPCCQRMRAPSQL